MQYEEIKRSDVTIIDAFLSAKTRANKSYMMSLESDALLLHHKTEAVIPVPFHEDQKHGGWESPLCQLRGHFAGHWLSAAAMQYASTGDVEIKAKADTMISELALCQKANGGEWAASIPEKYLYRIAEGERVWAPHYTIHKTFMGLIDMYEYAGNKTALEIAKNMAKWFLRWTAKFSRQEMDNILEVETGGMLEMWAALYGITEKKEFLTLMDRYYRGRLFDPLLAGEDVLTNMHANTTIPEVLGAARSYEVTGDKKWLDIVKAYWKSAVTDRGQYCTGGQTSGEIWSPPMELAARLGDKNQEHCTVYNMMRVADFLFRITGDKKYADYWEQNLYNGIFAQGYWKGFFTHGYKSDFPDTGLLTYFLPLRAGARKAWASPKGDFFCCHGTLVQANASLNRGIYYAGKDVKNPSLAICQFFDSSVTFTAGSVPVKLEQHINNLSGSTHLSSDSTGVQAVNKMAMDIPHNPHRQRCEFKVAAKSPAAFELKIRLPWWAKGTPILNINGKKEKPLITDGFIVIEKTWANDTFYIEFQKSITLWPLPDKNDSAAFMYGPVALAGLCDEDITLKGNINKPEDILVDDNEREWGNWMNTFKTQGQSKNIRFIPVYAVGYEPYTVYFNLNP